MNVFPAWTYRETNAKENLHRMMTSPASAKDEHIEISCLFVCCLPLLNLIRKKKDTETINGLIKSEAQW